METIVTGTPEWSAKTVFEYRRGRLVSSSPKGSEVIFLPIPPTLGEPEFAAWVTGLAREDCRRVLCPLEDEDTFGHFFPERIEMRRTEVLLALNSGDTPPLADLRQHRADRSVRDALLGGLSAARGSLVKWALAAQVVRLVEGAEILERRLRVVLAEAVLDVREAEVLAEALLHLERAHSLAVAALRRLARPENRGHAAVWCFAECVGSSAGLARESEASAWLDELRASNDDEEFLAWIEASSEPLEEREWGRVTRLLAPTEANLRGAASAALARTVARDPKRVIAILEEWSRRESDDQLIFFTVDTIPERLPRDLVVRAVRTQLGRPEPVQRYFGVTTLVKLPPEEASALAGTVVDEEPDFFLRELLRRYAV